MASGEEVARLDGDFGFLAIHVAPDGKSLAVGDDGGRVHLLGPRQSLAAGDAGDACTSWTSSSTRPTRMHATALESKIPSARPDRARESHSCGVGQSKLKRYGADVLRVVRAN